MGTSESAGGAGGCESVSFRFASDGERFRRSASGDGEGSRVGEEDDRWMVLSGRLDGDPDRMG